MRGWRGDGDPWIKGTIHNPILSNAIQLFPGSSTGMLTSLVRTSMAGALVTPSRCLRVARSTPRGGSGRPTSHGRAAGAPT